jgi:iron complex outermembrane receptor protein
VTRIGVDLSDLASSVVVLNKAFIDGASPTIMAKSLNYVGGAQTGTITWSVDRYMIRGFVGEGDYVDGFRTQTDKNTDLNLIDHIEIIKGPSAIFIANAANTVGGVINKVSKSPTSYNEGSLTVQVGRWDANRADLDIGGPITADKKLCLSLPHVRPGFEGLLPTHLRETHRHPADAQLRFQQGHPAVGQVRDVRQPLFLLQRHPARRPHQPDRGVPYNTNFDGEDTPNNWRTDWYYRLWGQFTTRPAPWIAIRLAAFDSKDTQRRVESILSHGQHHAGHQWREVSVPGYQIPASYTPGTLLSRGTTAVNGDYQPRREIQHDYVFSFDTGPASHKLLVGAVLVDYPEDTKTYSSGGTSTATSSLRSIRSIRSSRAVSVNFNQPPVSFNHITQNFAKVFALETASFLKNRVIANIGVTRSRYESSKLQNNYNQVTGRRDGGQQHIPRSGRLQKPRAIRPARETVSNVSLFYDNSKNFAYNGFGTTPAGINGLLPPSQGEQKEVGAKSTWLDNRLTFNVAYFNTVQFNNTVPAFPQTNPPTNVVVGGETSRGFDGDFAFKVNKNVDFLGSFAYFKAHIDLAAPWNQIIQPGDGKVHSNIPVNNVAEHTLALWGRYNFTDAR